MAHVGSWAFVVGLVLAVLGGLVFQGLFFWLVALLGLFVGFLNVSGATRSFLLAAIGLIVAASAWSNLPQVGGNLSAILANIVAFTGTAVLLVALKVLFETVKD